MYHGMPIVHHKVAAFLNLETTNPLVFTRFTGHTIMSQLLNLRIIDTNYLERLPIQSPDQLNFNVIIGTSLYWRVPICMFFFYYIKIFLFMSIFHLSALKSVL